MPANPLGIVDGQTRKAYFAPSKLWAALRFSYRPCTRGDKLAYMHRSDTASPEELDRRATDLLKRKFLGGTLGDPQGTHQQVSSTEAGKLEPMLLEQVLMVILGYGFGDDDPDAAPAEKETALADKF